jgi:hypothetical protein
MDNLLEQSEIKVTELYKSLTKPELLYHNLVHTREVVDAVQLMRSHYTLSAEDDSAVGIAAFMGHRKTTKSWGPGK